MDNFGKCNIGIICSYPGHCFSEGNRVEYKIEIANILILFFTNSGPDLANTITSPDDVTVGQLDYLTSKNIKRMFLSPAVKNECFVSCCWKWMFCLLLMKMNVLSPADENECFVSCWWKWMFCLLLMKMNVLSPADENECFVSCWWKWMFCLLLMKMNVLSPADENEACSVVHSCKIKP